MRRNDDIRNYAKQNNVKLWEVAERIGIADSTLCRQMRHELTPGRRESLLEAIRELSAKGTATAAAQ